MKKVGLLVLFGTLLLATSITQALAASSITEARTWPNFAYGTCQAVPGYTGYNNVNQVKIKMLYCVKPNGQSAYMWCYITSAYGYLWGGDVSSGQTVTIPIRLDNNVVVHYSYQSPEMPYLGPYLSVACQTTFYSP